MRIGIDARMINASGIGRYIKNLLTELQKIDHKNEYYIFLLKDDYDTLVNHNKNFHKVLADFRWYGIEEQRKFPFLLQKYNLDLVHFPHFNIPIFYRRNFVVTIHDLIHYDFKMQSVTTRNPFIYEIKHMMHKQVVNESVRRAKKVITVSHFVENELVSRLNVDRKKLTVTYEAVDDKFFAAARILSQQMTKKILEKFGIKPPFLFYVGNAHPHKNVEGLIRAFRELRGKYQYLQLVLVGNESVFWQKIRREFNDKDIIYLENISDRELVALYKSAKAYVFPSFAEGFGLPLLEAMACGCPVVSSDRTSLPEVGGDAALYFDPNNRADMVEKIGSVLNDQSLRKDLIAKGEKRVKQFSWEKLANQTLEVYNDSLNG